MLVGGAEAVSDEVATQLGGSYVLGSPAAMRIDDPTAPSPYVSLQQASGARDYVAFGTAYRTRSKAGWISAGGPVYEDVNGGRPLWDVSDDGGIVYAPNGPYVMAIMSNVSSNHNLLNALTLAIDGAHNEMMAKGA